MKGFRDYFGNFVRDESGTAIIEWVIVIAIVAVMVPLIMTVARSAGNKINMTSDEIESIDTNSI